MNKNWIKATLLLTSTMTVMAGAIVAPSLPQIHELFQSHENAGLLTKLIITLPALFIAVSAPFIGLFVDNIGRKNMLLYALMLYGISGSAAFFIENLYLILITRAFLGIAIAGILIATTTLTNNYFSGKERNSFIGIQGAFIGFGGVVFILVSGILADISWQLPFLIYGFAFPVLILSFFSLYETDKLNEIGETEEVSTQKIPFIKASLVYFFIFISIVFFFIIPVQIPFVMSRIEGVNNSMIGYAISAAIFAAVLTSLNYKFLKSRYSFPALYFQAFLFMSVGFMIISLSYVYWQIVTGLVISGFGMGLILTSGNFWIQEIAPDRFKDSMIAIATIVSFFGQFISPVFIEPIIRETSVASSFYLVAVTMLVFGIIIILSYRIFLFFRRLFM